MHDMYKCNKPLYILAEVFSFSVDELLWIGITCVGAFLLSCTRGFGMLRPIGCIEEALWYTYYYVPCLKPNKIFLAKNFTPLCTLKIFSQGLLWSMRSWDYCREFFKVYLSSHPP